MGKETPSSKKDIEGNNTSPVKKSSGKIHIRGDNLSDATTSSGNIIIDENCPGNAKASSGKIVIKKNLSGQVETSSGNVKIKKEMNNGTVRTSNGEVEIGNDMKKGKIVTSSGSVEIGGDIGHECSIKTSSGEVEGRENSGNIQTSSGNVELRTNHGTVHTNSGNIEVGTNNGNMETNSGEISIQELNLSVRREGGSNIQHITQGSGSRIIQSFIGDINTSGSTVIIDGKVILGDSQLSVNKVTISTPDFGVVINIDTGELTSKGTPLTGNQLASLVIYSAGNGYEIIKHNNTYKCEYKGQILTISKETIEIAAHKE